MHGCVQHLCLTCVAYFHVTVPNFVRMFVITESFSSLCLGAKAPAVCIYIRRKLGSVEFRNCPAQSRKFSLCVTIPELHRYLRNL